MTSAIACTSCARPQISAAGGANSSKEAALQQQIDVKSAQRARTGCDQTAAKIGKDIATLKAELGKLQATDKSKDAGSQSLSSPATAARQAEFDDEADTRNVIWV
jgi:hypothetical protein